MNQPASIALTFWLAIAFIILGTLLYLLAPILIPFIFAMALAYLFHPVVDRLEQNKISRGLGALTCLVLIVAVLALLLVVVIPMLQKQIVLIADQLPGYLNRTKEVLAPWLKQNLSIEINYDIDQLKDFLVHYWQNAKGSTSRIFLMLKNSGEALVNLALNLVLVLVLFFYLARDWHRFVNQITALIPPHLQPGAIRMAGEIDQALSGFVRGQLLDMLLMSLFYIVALSIVGLNVAIAVGMISGLLTFVPFLGVIVGVVLSTFAGMLQFHTLTNLLYIWLVFIIANVIEGYVFQPLLIGSRIGLHPVAVIFSVLAGAQLFGFVGILLGLPVGAIIQVIWQNVRQRYLNSRFYQ